MAGLESRAEADPFESLHRCKPGAQIFEVDREGCFCSPHSHCQLPGGWASKAGSGCGPPLLGHRGWVGASDPLPLALEGPEAVSGHCLPSAHSGLEGNLQSRLWLGAQCVWVTGRCLWPGPVPSLSSVGSG